MRGSGLFGEMGLYSGRTRSADALVEKDSSLYFLSSDSFKKLHKEHPGLAMDFHQIVVRLLSDRIREYYYEV